MHIWYFYFLQKQQPRLTKISLSQYSEIPTVRLWLYRQDCALFQQMKRIRFEWNHAMHVMHGFSVNRSYRLSRNSMITIISNSEIQERIAKYPISQTYLDVPSQSTELSFSFNCQTVLRCPGKVYMCGGMKYRYTGVQRS